MMSTFYKYRADNQFTESLITTGKVFLATAQQLNDPFECSLADISRTWVDHQVSQTMQASIEGFAMSAHLALTAGESFFDLAPWEIENALEPILKAGDLEIAYSAWRAFINARTGHPSPDCRELYHRIDEQLTETGIFSLSADPVQPLMWAHYGHEHQGLCLGFRAVEGSKLADPSHFLPVTYSNALPVMDGEGLRLRLSMAADAQGRPYTSSRKLAFDDPTFQRVVSTKSVDWEYEQEHRYVEPFGGLCEWPGLLAECTFGLRCSDDRRRHYIELLESHVPNDVALFEIRAKRGTSTYERVKFDPPATRSRRSSLPDAASPTVMSAEDFAARMGQLIQQERYGEVIAHTSENLKLDPSAPILLHLKATAHGLAHEHREALAIFEQLTVMYPEAGAGWYGMACALQALEQLDQVVPLLRKAVELAPDDPSIALNLGIHLSTRSETRSEALLYLRKAERLGHRRASRLIDDLEAG